MEQLQELYRHLEHAHHGDRHMAYYGQCRAQELSHKEALEKTIEHFRLRHEDWYRFRFRGE
jgi:hypothetical protein